MVASPDRPDLRPLPEIPARWVSSDLSAERAQQAPERGNSHSRELCLFRILSNGVRYDSYSCEAHNESIAAPPFEA